MGFLLRRHNQTCLLRCACSGSSTNCPICLRRPHCARLMLPNGIKRRMTCEDFCRKARKQVPRIASLCAGSADAALRQKDRKAASFYSVQEHSSTPACADRAAETPQNIRVKFIDSRSGQLYTFPWLFRHFSKYLYI